MHVHVSRHASVCFKNGRAFCSSAGQWTETRTVCWSESSVQPIPSIRGTAVDPLGELLASDHRRTLEFFVMNLKDVSEPTVDQQELLYNASVLAHYAQISVDGDIPMATPADLTAVFDHFVADMNVLNDPLMLETAGAQCLLLAGFCEDQTRRRHNSHWYAEKGAGFFRSAGVPEQSASKGKLLDTIGRHGEPWRRRHARLSHELRDSPYLISSRTPPF